MNLYDVIIVGSGPAGLNAALYLGRARRSVLLCNAGQQRNAVATEMHGFLTREGVLPKSFFELTKHELQHYPNIEMIEERVEDAIVDDETFILTFASGIRQRAKRLLLATGMKDILPKIDGLAERWGKSVFVCPFCDGWEVRDQSILICGSGRDTVELAQELYGWSKSLHLCAEHDELTAEDHTWIKASHSTFRIGSIEKLTGKDAALQLATLHNGETIECTTLFLSAPLRQRCNIANTLGCAFTNEGAIAVTECNETSIPGCYAAGDAMTHFHQVVIAAASGAATAMHINNELLDKETTALIASTKGHLDK